LQLLLIPVIIKISRKNGWYDPKDPRKIHNGNTAHTGGAGIFLAFMLTSCIFSPPGALSRNLPLLAGICIMFFMGLLDDFKNLRARYKLALQILAAILAVAAGFRFSVFALPFRLSVTNTVVVYGVSVAWIVGVTNAINLIDGMDGLAAGVGGIAALFWGLLAFYSGYMNTALYAAALVGAVAGFLMFNKPPAKVFMGDSGSMVIGYILAVLPLMEKGAGAGSTRTLLLAVTLLVIPVFDTISSIFRRIRQGKSIADPDMHHVHHKLLKLGFTAPKILIIVYGFCVFSGGAAFLWAVYPERFNIYFLPLAWLPSLILFRFLHILHWRPEHHPRRQP
jgi:UDP-GlcNAc:undecaprenyl-phosphate GlcNAc-1-phosphate transferase